MVVAHKKRWPTAHDIARGNEEKEPAAGFARSPVAQKRAESEERLAETRSNSRGPLSPRATTIQETRKLAQAITLAASTADDPSVARQQRRERAAEEAAASGEKEAGGQEKGAGRGRGFLEALLGERGKSWLEQRTVILDIQNGRGAKAEGRRAGRSADLARDAELRRSESVGRVADRSEGEAREAENQFDNDDAIQQVRQVGIPNRRRQSPIILASNRTSKQNVDLRVPTFGSVPQRLGRLPYFSYQGKAKNVNISTANDRQAYTLVQSSAASKTRASAATLPNSSSASSSSSSSSSTERTSGQPRITSTSSNSHSPPLGSPARQAKRSPPYSNISNLFARKPNTTIPGNRVTQAATIQQRSTSQASLLSTAAKKSAAIAGQQMNRRRNSFAHLANSTPAPAAGQAASQQQRQHSGLLLQPRTRSSQSISGAQRDSSYQQQQPFGPTYANRARQQVGGGSALGAGRRVNVGATNTLPPRRPVSSAANYAARSPTGPRAGSLRFDSPYGPALIDPDCPVHGDDDEQHRTPLGGRRYGAPTLAANKVGVRRTLEHAVSQPELLYEADRERDHDHEAALEGNLHANYKDDNEDDYQRLSWQPHWADQYQGDEQRTPANAHKSPQIYSPVSPTLRSAGQRSRQQQAYYNSSSRFSLYHPSSDGIQSSLAPTSEQLRRILGYKPTSAKRKPVHLHPQWAYSRPFIHLQPANLGSRRRSSASPPLDDHEDQDLFDGSEGEFEGPRFWPFNRLQDTQAIRAVDFHPNGEVYAIGSNSRALRICAYPAEQELRHFRPLQSGIDEDGDKQRAVGAGAVGAKPPRVLFKFLQLHRGSIYCVSFNPSGQLLATGSNDQTVHLVKYNSVSHNPDGDEFRLTMHNGTVRDLCFIDDSFGSGSSLLLSAGGGDNKIYVTDCDTVTPYQSMAGHTQMVMALNHCGGAQFVSGSYDKTVRFWDLRTRTCTSIVSAPPASGGGGAGAPISALRVDPSGRLLASGHTDSTCMLYDIRGAKIIQTFRPHDDEIRAISFSPKSYYLLTGSYDGRLVLSDLQGDLTRPLPSACVAECHDKIVQAKWHPSDFTFVSTSADKSATLWALPGELV